MQDPMADPGKLDQDEVCDIGLITLSQGSV